MGPALRAHVVRRRWAEAGGAAPAGRRAGGPRGLAACCCCGRWQSRSQTFRSASGAALEPSTPPPLPGSCPAQPQTQLLPGSAASGCLDSGPSKASSEAGSLQCRNASPCGRCGADGGRGRFLRRTRASGPWAPTALRCKAISGPQVSGFKVCRKGLRTKRILFQECLCDAVWSLEIESLFYRNKERVIIGGLTHRVLRVLVSCTLRRSGGLGASSCPLSRHQLTRPGSGRAGVQAAAF